MDYTTIARMMIDKMSAKFSQTDKSATFLFEKNASFFSLPLTGFAKEPFLPLMGAGNYLYYPYGVFLPLTGADF